MKSLIVSSNEFTYPDVFAYASAAEKAVMHEPRGTFASFQLLFCGIADASAAKISVSGGITEFGAEYYELCPVYVEGNTGIDDENAVPGCPNRKAPFFVYDCLKPFDGTLTPKNGAAGFYVTFYIPRGIETGIRTGQLTVEIAGEKTEVPVEITVYNATIPEKENLKIVNGYSSAKTAEYFNVKNNPDELFRLDTEHLKMLRRMRQNMLYIGGVGVKNDRNGNYAFDFSALEKNARFYMSLGFKYFNMSSVGGRRSWKEPTILVGPEHLEAMSYEAYRYLSQYLPALRAFLLEHGWMENFMMGVSDEPNDANATEFRALCGLVRKFIPEIKLADALSYTNVHGALDVWIPLNAEYDKHRAEFESFRTGRDEIWHYVCCVPRREGYINRFMDYPLLSTRYLFWGNYKYSLTGYLHWASNCYQPGQDPFLQNNPLHKNADSTCYLPAGDTHLIYPGRDGHPWMSIRLEAQRRSAEDYELLLELSQKDKAKADAICEKCMRSFNDVEYDTQIFDSVRTGLLNALSE